MSYGKIEINRESGPFGLFRAIEGQQGNECSAETDEQRRTKNSNKE